MNSVESAVKTKVCISVDVEPSVAGAFANPSRFKPLLAEPVEGKVNGRSEALGFLLRTLREMDLRATFFVETLHPAYFGEEPMRRYVEDLLEANQDVELHVHPCWLTFRNGRPDLSAFVSDECADHPEERLVEILSRGKAQLKRWTGHEPVGFRSGGFSVNRAVYSAMRRVGLRASSNICLAYTPPSEDALRLAGGVHAIEDVFEFPVTCFRDPGRIGRSRMRGLQITACARWELRELINAAWQQGQSYVVIVTHPFEFVKRDSDQYTKMAVNKVNQQRFRWLCSYLAANTDRFEVVTLAELAQREPERLNERPAELSGKITSSVARSVQNVLNDHIWAL